MSWRVSYFGWRQAPLCRQKHTAEKISSELGEAEVLYAEEMSMEGVMCQLGVSDATYFKWRKEYGALWVDEAKRP